MPSPTLTAAQAKKQKEALAEHHKNGPTSAGSVKPPRALSDMGRKLDPMIDSAVDVIQKSLEGDSTVTATQVNTAKWVYDKAMAIKKAALDEFSKA